jgi:hypothetical protein
MALLLGSVVKRATTIRFGLHVVSDTEINFDIDFDPVTYVFVCVTTVTNDLNFDIN